MKLSDKPFNELEVGMLCISAIGTPGAIIDLLTEGIDGVRGDSIILEWNNGNISYPFHCCCDNITLIEPDAQSTPCQV